MEKILILSDLHHDGSTEASDVIRATLAHALARHGDASAIYLAGDLATNGKPAEYAALSQIFARITIPVTPLPGNKDRRRPLVTAFPKTETTAQGHIQTVKDLHRHRIITLDTLDGPPFRSSHHAGHLCPDRMAWLIRELEGAPNRHKIVIAHHPPMKIGLPGIDALRLKDGPPLLELLSSYPGTQLITGHTRRAANGMSRGIPWATLAPVRGPLALTLDTEELDPAPQPPSYGVLLLQKHGSSLHQQQLPG